MADSTSGAFLDSSKDTLEDSSSARILSSRELQEPRMEVKKAKGVRGGLEIKERQKGLESEKELQPPRDPKKQPGMSKSRADDDPEGNQERRGHNIPNNTSGASTPPAWKQLITHPLTQHERISQIATIFSDRDEVEMIKQLSGDEAQAFVDLVDEVLDSLAPQIRRECSRAMYRLCGRQALLPQSLAIPLCYDPTESPLCHGGFADVWGGRYRGLEVAAKVLRVHSMNDPRRIGRIFCREVAAWRTLRHPNVLPLLGVTVTNDQLVMVSEWMTNGNIREYLETNINADRLGLLGDITMGLIYMHGQGIVHGNLKAANILVDRGGHACLADFSLLTVVSGQSTQISSSTEGGTVQWMSPELLDPERFNLEGSHPTKESDCYALGMVVYEVLSGQTPFAPSKVPVVLEGRHPRRPQGAKGRLFTDALWEVLGLCWKVQPSERASAKAVFQALGGNLSLVQLASDADEDMEIHSDSLSNIRAEDSRPMIMYGDSPVPQPSSGQLPQPSLTPLQQLRSLNRASSEFCDQLSNILRGEAYKEYILNLQGNDLVSVIDYLDNVLNSLDPPHSGFWECLDELRKICGSWMILPTSYTLSSSLLNVDCQPVASGGTGDVYEGTLNNSRVCVKRVRVYSKDGPGKATKTLYQGAVVWKHLDHPNIVSLLGIISTPLQLISEWIVDGDLAEYIGKHPEADRLGLLRGIADGLHYLHTHINVAHGDLKGPNILIGATGVARITDFGLSRIIQDRNSPKSTTDDERHIPHWPAPEILWIGSPTTKESDVFSLGMVAHEVLTGEPPFSGMGVPAVIKCIMDGERPRRPNISGITELLWTLIQRCWDKEARNRPEIWEVITVLGDISTTPVTRPDAQTHRDQQEKPRQPRNLGHVTPTSQPLESTSGTEQEVLGTPQKKHGLWCRFRRRFTRAVGGGTTNKRSPRRASGAGRSNAPVSGSSDMSGRKLRKRMKRGKETAELKEKFKEGEKREEPGYGEEGEGAEEVAEEAEEAVKEEAPEPTGSATELPVQTEFTSISPAATRGPSFDNRSGDCEDVPPAAGSTDVDNVSLSMPQDRLAQSGQSVTDLQAGIRIGSCLDLSDKSGEALSRHASRADPSGVGAGYTTGNASYRGSHARTKSRNQPPMGLGEALADDQGSALHGPHQNQPEHRRGSREDSGAPNSPTNCEQEGEQEWGVRIALEAVPDRSNHPGWKRLIEDTLAVHERIHLIATIFSDGGGAEMVRHLSRDDAQIFVDTIDHPKTLDSLEPQVRRRCLRSICRICGRQVLLPRSLEIPLCYDPTEDPVCGGGCGDVWKGEYQGREVAVKVMKVYKKKDPARVRRMFCREVIAWWTLCHPNVLPLLGATMSEGRLMMVSEWMTNGHINRFVNANANV